MTELNKIQAAIDQAIDRGQTPQDEMRFAQIEALLRDFLGQSHGVWRWRVGLKKRQRRLDFMRDEI